MVSRHAGQINVAFTIHLGNELENPDRIEIRTCDSSTDKARSVLGALLFRANFAAPRTR